MIHQKSGPDLHEVPQRHVGDLVAPGPARGGKREKGGHESRREMHTQSDKPQEEAREGEDAEQRGTRRPVRLRKAVVGLHETNDRLTPRC